MKLKGNGIMFRFTMALGIGCMFYTLFGSALVARYTQVAPGVEVEDNELLDPKFLDENIEK